MRHTLPADMTGEDALTLYLAASVAPSLTPDELDESLPRLRHLAELMTSRRAAAPADVPPATVTARLDPPTDRLRPVEPEPAPEPAESPRARHALAPIRGRKRTVLRRIARFLLAVAVLVALFVGAFLVAVTSPMPPSPTSNVPAPVHVEHKGGLS